MEEGTGVVWIFLLVLCAVAVCLYEKKDRERQEQRKTNRKKKALALLQINKERILEIEEWLELVELKVSIEVENASPRLDKDYETYRQEELAKRAQTKSEERRKQEQELIDELPKLSVLVSAKIAQEVVAQFNATRIIEVADLLSASELEEGIQEANRELRPIYERRLVEYFKDTTGIESLEARHLEKELAQCMAHGLKAIMQLEKFEPLLAQKDIKHDASSRIVKGRSWKDIKSRDE